MSEHAAFPFAALVGLDTVRLALELAAVDVRLSILIRGDKGAGKSTAARGLAELLPTGAPFVNLPIGATEDRLLGGLNIERTLQGDPVLKPGLVSRAHGGVLYIDEINLLPDHLADALLDAAASGVLIVEREGFSLSQPADFVLLGSMNPEEGALRPQLLDRFALVADVVAPTDPATRADVIARRLSHDRDPVEFRKSWADEQQTLTRRLTQARERCTTVNVSSELLRYVSGRISELGVRSLRADLAAVRASRAFAALSGAKLVSTDHVDVVLPLALAHRMPARSRVPPPSPPAPPPRPNQAPETPADGDPSGERVFKPVTQTAPRVVIDRALSPSGASNARAGAPIGPQIAARRTERPEELDLRASVVHALSRAATSRLGVDDLHERVRAPRRSTRFILVIDSSGSHAVQDRMRLVKGVAGGLLDSSHGRHDEVVVIGCRGPAAEVLVEPTSSRDDAERALEYLPTGGRTPLAHAIELAAGYETDDALLILMTDGRANVPTQTDDPWADTQRAARAFRCAALVIDTEDARTATGRPRELADALRGRYAKLDELDASQVLTIVRASQ